MGILIIIIMGKSKRKSRSRGKRKRKDGDGAAVLVSPAPVSTGNLSSVSVERTDRSRSAIAFWEKAPCENKLATDDTYFCKMLDFIPKEYYFPKTDEEKEAEWRSGRGARYMVNKNKGEVGKSSKTSKREKKRQKFGAVDPQLTSDLVGKKAEAGAESTPVENDAMETEDAAKPAPAKNLSELRERLALRLKAMKASRSTGNKPMGAKNKSAGPKSNGSAAKAKAVAAENGQDKAGKRRKIYDKLTASMGDSPTPIKENISFGVIEVDGKGKKDSGEDAKRGGGKILRVEKLLQKGSR